VDVEVVLEVVEIEELEEEIIVDELELACVTDPHKHLQESKNSDGSSTFHRRTVEGICSMIQLKLHVVTADQQSQFERCAKN
jgi:hypothetical protein